MQAAEEATGKTAAEIYKMMENGQLLAKDFLVPFAGAMRRIVRENKALQKATEKLTSQQNRMNTAYKEMVNEVFQQGGADFFGSIFKLVSRLIGYTQPLVTGILGPLLRVGATITDAVSAMLELVKAIGTLGDSLGVLDAISSIFSGIGKAINATLANIYELIALVYDLRDTLSGTDGAFTSGIANVVGRARDAVVQDWNKITNSQSKTENNIHISVDARGYTDNPSMLTDYIKADILNALGAN